MDCQTSRENTLQCFGLQRSSFSLIVKDFLYNFLHSPFSKRCIFIPFSQELCNLLPVVYCHLVLQRSCSLTLKYALSFSAAALLSFPSLTSCRLLLFNLGLSALLKLYKLFFYFVRHILCFFDYLSVFCSIYSMI